jgi:hypothetical protein
MGKPRSRLLPIPCFMECAAESMRRGKVGDGKGFDPPPRQHGIEIFTFFSILEFERDRVWLNRLGIPKSGAF